MKIEACYLPNGCSVQIGRVENEKDIDFVVDFFSSKLGGRLNGSTK